MGLGFVVLNLDEEFGNSKIRVQIDHEKLLEQGMSLVNTKARIL